MSQSWWGIRIFVQVAVVVVSNGGCTSGQMASPTDGSSDRRGDGQDARDGSNVDEGPGDTRDGPVDAAVADAILADAVLADAILDVVDMTDVGDEMGDGPVDATMADATMDSVDAADAAQDGASSDTPMETGRPYVERACSKSDACVCASNESCSFSCPSGDCEITCAGGSTCTVSCAAPFGCSVSCGNDAQCILACNLGVCAHFFGPSNDLVCDSGGLGCL